MTSISSYAAASWLPSAVSAQQQGANNWISQNLDPTSQSQGLGLPNSAALQDFLDTTAALADTFASAQQNQFQGLAVLAIQGASARVKAELAAQIDNLISATSTASTAASAPSTINLTNGSMLDLTKNTFTLNDGTVLDINSGRKLIGGVLDVTA